MTRHLETKSALQFYQLCPRGCCQTLKFGRGLAKTGELYKHTAIFPCSFWSPAQ
jgi:hypothetical protein